jgi:hypothetical protein
MNDESKNAKIVAFKNTNLWVIIWGLIALANIVRDTEGTRVLYHQYLHITNLSRANTNLG